MGRERNENATIDRDRCSFSPRLFPRLPPAIHRLLRDTETLQYSLKYGMGEGGRQTNGTQPLHGNPSVMGALRRLCHWIKQLISPRGNKREHNTIICSTIKSSNNIALFSSF